MFISRETNRKIQDYLLTNPELDVLHDIRKFLWIPHLVQEALSGEQHPTASMVLPMYEQLLLMLQDAHRELPQIAHGIDASIAALERYMHKSRQTDVYALAMSES